MLADFETHNDVLGNLIARIAADPMLHAKWLNTFSFLEYIGFRKIVKSQRAEVLSISLLSHALEEGRHAFALKKLAAKLGGPSFEYYKAETLLCPDEAEAYFQDLDHQCESGFAGQDAATRQRLAYLYVTWLVECRALEVYGLYKQAVAQTEISQKLEGLLGEEASHLTQVEAALAKEDLQFSTRSKHLQDLEAKLYERFVEALGRELSSADPSAPLSASA